MKIIVCESCEAEFRLAHSLDERLYKVTFCPFCGTQTNEDLEDDMEELGYDSDEETLYE